ncbi:MAG: CARDB domain-containing protein [Patescibacteria group bacterium]
MTHSYSRTRAGIIWFLVTGVFTALVVFWIPSLTGTVRALSGEIGKGTSESSEQFSKEWSSTQKEIKLLTDTIASVSKESSPFSQTQMETFAKEIDAHASTPKDLAAFPVHEDAKEEISVDTDPVAASCTRIGGRYVSRTTEKHDYGVCMFKDGSECEVSAFASGACRQGQYRKAEDGITTTPDLVLEVEKAGYCSARTAPIAWTEDESADYICLQGVTIKNIGWGDAKASTIKTAGKYYDVPALAAGESFTFSDHFPFIKAKVNNQAVIVVDAKNNVSEFNEDNNVYTFPK